MSNTGAPRWVVAQVGAREHYLAARALHRVGALKCMLTDVWDPGGAARSRLGWIPAVARARGAWSQDLEAADVRAWGAPGLAFRALVRASSVQEAALYRAYNLQGACFARWARSRLKDDEWRDAAYFGFTSTSLETMAALKRQGVYCVLDQIDPGPLESKLVADERAAWAGWEAATPGLPAAYYERMRREWDVADKIVVNSEWSRRALVAEGVESAKIAVIPLALDQAPLSGAKTADAPRADGPLRVLWLGSVILRKGFPYLVDAARQLERQKVEITVAGPVHLTGKALAGLPPNMKLIGKVSLETSAKLRSASDVFVLPTISDGFAITQLEAMAQGLPVVTTPNCGDVVRDGVDGFIVPPRDARALAARLSEMAADRSRLGRMGAAARARAREFSLERYADSLTRLVGGA